MTDQTKAYLSEFAGTLILLFIGVTGISLSLGADSPLRPLVPSYGWRFFLAATLFSAGGVLVIYSPLGQRSGGHLNPAVTLAFWLLKKIRTRDALFFALSQFIGATAGSLLSFIFLGHLARSVRMGMTLPGEGFSVWEAFLAEVGITFALVTLILVCINIERLAKYTGLLAGLLVTSIVILEAPISGSSFNPARSLGPALTALYFSHQWIYLVAPLLGAAAAVGIFKAGVYGMRESICAKLYHPMDVPCIFDCGYMKMKMHPPEEGDAH